MGSALLSSLTLCGISGCHHKDLNEDAGQSFYPVITIEYDWDNNEELLPDGMANLFYDKTSNNESYWRSDFRPSGGSVRIPSGHYNALTFNNDTHDVVFEKIDSFEEFTLTTKETDTSGIPDDQLPFAPQKLYGQPDRMWGAVRNDVVISFEPVSRNIRFTPRRITREYQVKMTDVGHLESALRYYSAISDLASSLRFSTLSQTGNPVTVGNFMQPVDVSMLSTTITNFGPAPESNQQRLAVYMWLADGSRKVYIYDITQQIREAPDPMNVQITVKGPELPVIIPGEGGGNGGGMDVGVDDWEFVDIEL